MIVSIMQPAYLPWLGYFDRMARSDLVVTLDHVRLDWNSPTQFTNRNKIRTKDGWMWLTLPIRKKSSPGLIINELEINGAYWIRNHFKSLEQCYRRSTHWEKYLPWINTIFRQSGDESSFEETLSGCINFVTSTLANCLGVSRSIQYSSDMGITKTKSELVLEICQKVGATEYLSGPFGRTYLDLGLFEAAGIKVKFHDYQHPTYSQVYPDFEPYMSVLDLMFNHGPDSLKILTGGDYTYG